MQILNSTIFLFLDIRVSHASKKGGSMRITILKRVQEKIGIKEEDLVGFYEEKGKIVLKKWNNLFYNSKNLSNLNASAWKFL